MHDQHNRRKFPLRPSSPIAIIPHDNPSTSIQSISTAQLSFFQSHPLLASGDIFLKTSKFQRSRKYYAELRNLTIVVFRSAKSVSPSNIITSILVPNHTFTLHHPPHHNCPRIYISHPLYSLIYLKPPKHLLGVWRESLDLGKSAQLPSLSSLSVHGPIGRGGGGKVFIASKKPEDKLIALKVIDKSAAFRSAKTLTHALAEPLVMSTLPAHPFVLPLEFAFQTSSNIYLGTPLCPRGDLATYLRRQGLPAKKPYSHRCGNRLSESEARLVLSEVLLALEHLHKHGIVYRDLKLENILLDANGHVRLADFGLAHKLSGRTKSVCGTRNYVPPEMIRGWEYGFEVDMWSFGVLAWRLLTGRFPFGSGRTRDVFRRIRGNGCEIVRAPSGISREAAEMLKGLVVRDRESRWSVEEAKGCRFFNKVDWECVLRKEENGLNGDCARTSQLEDILGNFETSRVYGLTLGEIVGEDESLEKRCGRDTRWVVGLEYARCEGGMGGVEEKRTGGGMLRKIASVDLDLVDGLRKIASVDLDLVDGLKKIGSWGSGGASRRSE